MRRMRFATTEGAFQTAVIEYARSIRGVVRALSAQGLAEAGLVVSARYDLRIWDDWFRAETSRGDKQWIQRTNELLVARCTISARSGHISPYDVRFDHAPDRSAILCCVDYLRRVEEMIEEAERKLGDE